MKFNENNIVSKYLFIGKIGISYYFSALKIYFYWWFRNAKIGPREFCGRFSIILKNIFTNTKQDIQKNTTHPIRKQITVFPIQVKKNTNPVKLQKNIFRIMTTYWILTSLSSFYRIFLSFETKKNICVTRPTLSVYLHFLGVHEAYWKSVFYMFYFNKCVENGGKGTKSIRMI